MNDGTRKLFLLGACLIGAAGAAHASGRRPPPGRYSSWAVYWDGENGLNAAREAGKSLDEVSVFAVDFDGDFRPAPSPWTMDAVRELKRAFPTGAPRILLTVVNDVRTPAGALLKSSDCVHALVSDPARRAEHVRELADLAADADGLEIDYEGIRLEDRNSFSLFIGELADVLHGRGKTLSVVVEPKTSDVLKDRAGAVDWKAVAARADEVKVMAYFFNGPWSRPGPVAPADWVAEVAHFARGQIPAEKLCVTLTMNGCDWPAGARGKGLDYPKVAGLEARNGARRGWDDASASPSLRYAEGGVEHEVWFEDARSLREKVERLRALGVTRIGLWRLGSGDPAFPRWAFSD